MSLEVLGGDDDDFYAGTTIADLGPNTVNDAIPGAGFTITTDSINVGQGVQALNAPASEDLTNSTGNAALDLGPFASFNDAGIGNVDDNPNALFSFKVTAGDVEGLLTFDIDEGVRAGNGVVGFRSGFDALTGVSSFAAYDQFSTEVQSVQIVPAPSSLALLGLGGLAAARRRR